MSEEYTKLKEEQLAKKSVKRISAQQRQFNQVSAYLKDVCTCSPCVCMYVSVCVCLYVCMYVCVSVYVWMYMFVTMYVCICVCMYCVYACMYVCLYVCKCVNSGVIYIRIMRSGRTIVYSPVELSSNYKWMKTLRRSKKQKFTYWCIT